MGFPDKRTLAPFLSRIKQLGVKDEVVKVVRFAYYRNLAAAENQLDNAAKKPLLRYRDYGRGVYLGLKGLLEALRGSEDVAFITKLLKVDGERLPLRFGGKDLDAVHDEFDAGYIDVWKLIIYIVEDLKAHAPPPPPPEEE